jgi:hypothetical protein
MSGGVLVDPVQPRRDANPRDQGLDVNELVRENRDPFNRARRRVLKGANELKAVAKPLTGQTDEVEGDATRGHQED